ncbi:MAG: hypothetical protein AAGC99_04490 [Pseudomonadota bacterium]
MSNIGSIFSAFKGDIADNVGHAPKGDDRGGMAAAVEGLKEKFSEALGDKAADKSDSSGGGKPGLKSIADEVAGAFGDGVSDALASKASDKSDAPTDGDDGGFRSISDDPGSLLDKARGTLGDLASGIASGKGDRS